MPVTRSVRRNRRGRNSSQRGQSLVEFSLVLMPLALILLGIIQFGFIFNTYITVSNATRDATRLGTVYMYDSDCTKAQNDFLRNDAIRKAVISSMGQINTTSPRFTTTEPTDTGCSLSGGWSQSGTTFTNGDVVITYTLPTGITDSDARTGQHLTVQAAYHQDLIVPLVSTILPKDAGGRLELTGVDLPAHDGPGVRRGDHGWDERVIPARRRATETQVIYRCRARGCPESMRATAIRRRRGRTGSASPEAGQSLVEFSLILFPLFVILLAIIQFGLIFGSFVTMSNAARDAARLGTIFEYNAGLSKDQNDLIRNEAVLASVKTSMNVLGTSAPYFANTSTWTKSGLTYTNGDLVIDYVIPIGVLDSDSRTGQQMTVKATYHQDLVVPIISNFLPKDSGGRLALTGVVTMVIN